MIGIQKLHNLYGNSGDPFRCFDVAEGPEQGGVVRLRTVGNSPWLLHLSALPIHSCFNAGTA